MKQLLKKLDNFIDTMWRRTCATIFYYFDNRKDDVDIDWLNMANNMRFDEKKYWLDKTNTYLAETKHIDKWKNEQNNKS